MKTPLFFPTATYTPQLSTEGAYTLRHLCELAGTACKATGAWTERLITIERATTCEINCEPGDWGVVNIKVPHQLNDLEAARYALIAMAYGLMDGVARESIRGQSWARPSPPTGRPTKGTANNTRERQRKFQAKRKTTA